MSTLLLVEDDQSIVSSLSDYLGNEGFKIESASGQKEAIEKLNSDQYDLALVDIQLSNGNGFSVCSAIKERGTRPPAGKTVKLKFLGTGMISVMPVPLLAAHPRECSPQGRTRYVPSACACRWTCPVHLHRPPSQAL